MIETIPITMALNRWECSANMFTWVSQPGGLKEPFEVGQSRKAMPAPIVVVKAPRATRTKTQALASAANSASPGRYGVVREREGDGSMSGKTAHQKGRCCLRQTL